MTVCDIQIVIYKINNISRQLVELMMLVLYNMLTTTCGERDFIDKEDVPSG